MKPRHIAYIVLAFVGWMIFVEHVDLHSLFADPQAQRRAELESIKRQREIRETGDQLQAAIDANVARRRARGFDEQMQRRREGIASEEVVNGMKLYFDALRLLDHSDAYIKQRGMTRKELDDYAHTLYVAIAEAE